MNRTANGCSPTVVKIELVSKSLWAPKTLPSIEAVTKVKD